MTRKFRISLITCIYGVEEYIQEYAESIFSQTYNNIEYVFVNDGTKDASMQILEKVINNRFENLRDNIVIVNQENKGLPIARKTGIEHASGEYILFADPDDWLETNAIENILKKITETNADIIYFDLVKEYGHRQSIKRERHYTTATKEQWIVNIFNYTSHGYSVTKCFRRSIYTENVIHTPILGMHEDIYLMTQLIYHANSIAQLPMVLYHYRKSNKNSMCSQSNATRHIASSRNMLNLYEIYMGDIEHSPISKVADGILLRAGWHAIIHKHDFTKEFPWFTDAIHKSHVSIRFQLNILLQFIVKIITSHT